MKRFPIPRPLGLALLGLALATANAVAAPVLGFDFLMAQLETFPSLDQKLQYLKAHPPGGDEAKIAVAVALIQAAPPGARADTAFQVTQLLARQNPRPADNALFAATIAASLPERMAAEVAPGIILGTGSAAPDQFPKITAAVINSRTSTERNAAGILQAVVAGAPVGQASAIAAAVGASFADHPQLAREAPEIAAGITRGLLSKVPSQASAAQVQRQIGESVASLIALLPGSWQSNRDLIVRIGRAVAREVAAVQPGMAPAIVGIVQATLRAAAGASNISALLQDFRNDFNIINDPAVQAAIDQAVAQADQGLSPVGSSDDPLQQFSPTPYISDPPTQPQVTTGNVSSPESNVVNP